MWENLPNNIPKNKFLNIENHLNFEKKITENWLLWYQFILEQNSTNPELIWLFKADFNNNLLPLIANKIPSDLYEKINTIV